MSTPTVYGSSAGAGAPLSPGQRLAADAATAAEVRAHQTDPDVVALRVEQIRTQVARLMWAGIGLGLCFTMISVATFAAAGAPVGSLTWCSAWLLDPTVSLVLVAVLRAEQLTARWQVGTGAWPRVAKWVLLVATYVMNTWSSWAAGSLSGVVLHSVPPLVVVIAAEAVTDLQYALTECVQHAHTAATHRAELARAEQAQGNTDPSAHPPSVNVVGGHPAGSAGERIIGPAGEPGWRHPVNTTGPVADRAQSRGGEHRRPSGTKRSRRPVRRLLLADYVAQARAAWTPGVVVTPAWVRQVTTCSRGLSPKVAAALTAQLPARHTTTEPEGRAA
ncbi:MAG: hypothetical protein ACRDTX_15645 [Pseudonocardiaceae bacterium]